MHTEYLPTNPFDILDHVVEEIGEVLVAFGKFHRFGPYSKHPDGGLTNIESLYGELEDAYGAIVRALDMLEETSTIPLG